MRLSDRLAAVEHVGEPEVEAAPSRTKAPRRRQATAWDDTKRKVRALVLTELGTKADPARGFSSTQILPPCSSTTARASASPRP